MKDFDFTEIASHLGLAFETELLESLDWDEDLTRLHMEKLAEYFSVCTKSDPAIVKGDIAVLFPESVCKVVNKYLDIATKTMKDFYENLDEEIK